MMSEAAPFVFGIKNRNQFILSCFNTVLQDVRLHDKWWEAGTLVDGINTRFHLQDGMELKKTDLLRVINKVYIEKSSDGNRFIGADDSRRNNNQLRLFRDEFRVHDSTKKPAQQKYDLFQVTARSIPSEYRNAKDSATWMEQNLCYRLPRPSKRMGEIGSAISEAANKKKRMLEAQETVEGMVEVTAAIGEATATTATAVVSYWESGDARKLFAPKALYGMDCDVRRVVIERIGKLENINQNPVAWRELVDGGDQDDLCSEHDIFLIRQRSLYLACALNKFVREVTEQSRMTWQLCLEHAIKLLNDIGIETYSSWRVLARWHRRMAYSPREVFMKSPAPKSRLPPFFIENPDAMDAFKKYGVSNLKDLSVEMMHTYVLETLVPEMMARVEKRKLTRRRGVVAWWCRRSLSLQKKQRSS
jgi:hypothetical protein